MTNLVLVENLWQSFDFLRQLISDRLEVHNGSLETLPDFEEPHICDDNSPIALFIAQYQPTFYELAIVILALVPHTQPDFLNEIIAGHLPEGGEFPEFDGVKGSNYQGNSPVHAGL